MADLSGYEVTFERNTLLGTWHWIAKMPGGGELRSFGLWRDKALAERDALRRLQRFAERETLSGEDLRQRLSGEELRERVESGDAET